MDSVDDLALSDVVTRDGVLRLRLPVVIDPDDPDLYVFEASTIELTDAVRDALVMEIPTRIICSEDCKGLCPTCGVNRNLVSCTCQEGGEVTNPFAALKSIVLNDEEV